LAPTSLQDDERSLLQRTVDACDRLDKSLRDTRDALHRKIIRASAAVAIALLAALGAVIIGARARTTASDLSSFVSATEIDRAQARVSACVQANVLTERQRTAMVSGLRAIAPPGTLSATSQAALDKYATEVEAQLPYRDCSPAGIVAYYKNPPDDPAVKR
jgi:hypothetical protein